MGLLTRFLVANRRLSERLDPRADAAFYARYDAEVAAALAGLAPGALVADVGGGRTVSFADALEPGRDSRVVAVDVSPDELAANEVADETRVGDVARRIPFDDREVDLLVSRTLLEHVEDVDGAAREMARVLKPGATTLHLIPCRYALFALVARIVPFGLAKRVLHALIPESRGVVEFDVFYDKGTPAQLERVFRAAGFRDVEVSVTYDQANYFHALFPVFALVRLYQWVVERLGLRTMAAYALVRAVR